MKKKTGVALASFNKINQLWRATRRRKGSFSCIFSKETKSTLILENIALFVCIYGLNSSLKCSFKNILEKKHEVFIEVRLFQETCSAPKIPVFAPVTVNLTFHPNFNPNIWVSADLPIHIKLIHDNIDVGF